MFGSVGICEMNRRVRRKCARGSQRLDLPNYPETEDADYLKLSEEGVVDWTRLPDDTVLQLFTHLNYRDRANLSSTCKSWRSLGASPCLWQSLDLRAHKCDWGITDSFPMRQPPKASVSWGRQCDSLINLRAKNLKELSGDYCRKLTDSTLAVIVARHKLLRASNSGPISVNDDAIVAIAFCCPNLRKLRLSGIRDVNGEAINALAKHCPNLTEIGFIDCLSIDEVALANVVSLRFLSVAGTTNVKWGSVGEHWCKLPNLKGLDVSRTDVVPNVVVRFFSSLKSLKILCAFNCASIEEDTSVVIKSKSHGKMLLSFFNDTFKEISPLFPDTEKERDVFSDWRKESKSKTKDENLDEIMTWLEWILSHSLLRIAESNPHGLDQFWLSQGADLLLNLMQSSQEDVQERAATGLATFVVIDDENANVDVGRAEAVMKGGGIQLLLGLARSWKEGLQSEATKAIANLSVNPAFAKSVAAGGGITILANLARSMNRLVAEEAAGGLWNLSVGEEHKGAIAEAGGIKALVDLIFKWPRGGDGVLERAAGALANLAADDKCSMEVANVGGINALVTLARKCKHEGVQEQAARALANLAAHGDSNTNNAAVGQETGALEALVLLIRSQHDGVRQEAAGALWNLSFDDRNREGIATAGGVEALVALAHSCSNASASLQERAAGALWGLSVSEANSIAIGREGGVAPLISLARSQTEDVHETAAGALWNLAFNPGNALRIVEDGGVPALIHLCSSSLSKMARFMAALALAYMFDGRMDEYALVGSSSEGSLKSVGLERARRMALKHIETFVLTFADPQAFNAAALSSLPAPLAQVTDSARILEAGHLRCSGAEIGRFVAMLRNQSPVLKACAAFALLQFTVPGGRHAPHHVNLLQVSGAPRVLRAAAAAASAPMEAKIFARIVLRNLEHHQLESSV
ncbi:LOW QUALITY PROTEIN: hypothetical protein OSB04_011171 [Centaurea solstitialis]|uniref:F-box domain-containing protein n=1 Tax=Centaurea solstitialis TaxID=347529 RepID=A0AA38TS01_9ASTR|nr:LOW QUALITY PROTEIN: hypothetical protein OSB04_011171 [Centaurea solstitialis]